MKEMQMKFRRICIIVEPFFYHLNKMDEISDHTQMNIQLVVDDKVAEERKIYHQDEFECCFDRIVKDMIRELKKALKLPA